MTIKAATNCWTKAEDAAYAALPQLAAFQTLTQTVDAVAAAKFVFVDEVIHPDSGEAYTLAELQALRHYVVVSSANQGGYKITRSGVVGDLFDPSGVLVLYIERLVTELEQNSELSQQLGKEATDRWFKNRVGELIEQLADYFDKNSGPWIVDAVVTDGPWQTAEKKRETAGNWQGCEVTLRWGRS